MEHLSVNIIDHLESQNERGGVSLKSLPPGKYLKVHTINSCYHIILVDECEVLIRGGKHFPEWTKALLCGSTWGTCIIKIHYIGLGMHMEIRGKKFYHTSCVECITVSELDGSNAYTISCPN